METKSDGLNCVEWTIKLLDKAKSFGYSINTEKYGKEVLYLLPGDAF